MCPDVQILSVYIDEELPSPWKEKLETHLSECSSCREKLNKFKLIDKQSDSEQCMIDEAKDRVWQNLQSRRTFQPRVIKGNSSTDNISIWQKRLSIPIPAAAAAAIIIMLAALLMFRGNGQQITNNGLANQIDPYQRAGFLIATEEEEIPGIIPTSDINSVLQYLNSDSSEIIILKLPESKSFSRTGEPAILRAADYQQNEDLKGRRSGSPGRQQ